MVKIFCLIGQNYFLIEEKIKEITQKFKRISFHKDVKEFFSELEKNLNQRLIGDNFDLVLKNLEKLKKSDWEKLVSYLVDPKIKIVLVFNSEPTEFFSLLRKNNLKFEIIHLVTPKKHEWDNFVKDFLKKKGIKLPAEIIEFLKENYKDNLDFFLKDLEKMVILGEEGLKKEEIVQIISFHPHVFKIQEFFLEKKWPNFIHSFKKYLLEERNSYEVLSVLTFLFNSLLKIYLMKNYPRFKIEGHYYYLQKLKEKANKLETEEIKRLISSLAKTERKFKKFYLQPHEIPEDLVLNYLFSR